jgi:hypothetical protein
MTTMRFTALTATAALILTIAAVGLLAEDETDLMPEVREVVIRVESWPIWQHAELTTALRRSFDQRMLTPKRKWVSEFADLAGEAGVARVLHRGLYEKDTLVRGGGAYFSFTSRSNDYNQGPDISLEQGKFSSGFYGGCFGYVVELPSADLRKVGADAVPEWMRERAAVMFEHRRRAERPEARVGAVYAVRSVREDEADTLAVFQVLDLDEDGATFAWRILERYPAWSRRNR